MRIGKQQVIWSEADALSGTEITNPNDLTFHWTNFETAENLRKNLKMIKFNYILPDFLKTANNELEAFVIPGDFQGDTAVVGLTDARNPWTVQAPENTLTDYNRNGQPFSHIKTFADQASSPALTANLWNSGGTSGCLPSGRSQRRLQRAGRTFELSDQFVGQQRIRRPLLDAAAGWQRPPGQPHLLV